MPRRAVLAIALACLAAVMVALVPWTVSSSFLNDAVSRQLREVYGLEFAVGGRSSIAFLPAPRLKFEDVTLTAGSQPVVRGGHLRGEFRILPLLTGRMELAEVSLAGSRIDVVTDETGRNPWQDVAHRLRARAEGRDSSDMHVRRLLLSGGYIVVQDQRSGGEWLVRDVNVIANWSSPTSPVDLAGSLTWRGEPLTFSFSDSRPGAILAGRSTRFVLDAVTPGARLSLRGDANGGEDARIVGWSRFETRSLRDTLRWSGAELPLGSLTGAVTFEGDFTAERRSLSWPAVRLTLGADRLDGALSARLEGSRPKITATLAAEGLNLTDYFLPLLQARGSDGLWNADPIDLSTPTSGDLDMRLSATTARIGGVRLQDLAASIQVRPGRIEATIGRATLNRGLVKGRLGLSAAGDAAEMKLQGSFDRVDMGAFLAELGQPRWIAGTAQGSIHLDGTGETPADLMRQVHGKALVSVRQGELVGVTLPEALRRLERRPLAASFDWRGGRTPFDQAQAQITVTNGIGEITESGLSAPNIRGAVQGRVSLADRTLSAKASVEVTNTSPAPAPIVFDIAGPWEDVAVNPDPRALIQRSGAAQPLLPPEVRLSLDRELQGSAAAAAPGSQ
ncbi:MAG TPA: AsmA-like C-terminal region-containing protein [Beijerinckiaceae bacterium]|jgi:AsmA protein